MSSKCTTVKDQGSIGSCTAFATLGLMEYIQKNSGNTPIKNLADIFSERFTYYTTRVNIMLGTTADTGAYIRSALQSVVKYGTCLETSFPYNNDFSTKPSDTNYAEAKKYQVISYARFNEGENAFERQKLLIELKYSIANGFPVISGVVCYSNFFDSNGSGYVPVPSGKIIGRHAILLVRYDDTKQYFKFKNSWSSGWGDKGYGYLPYSYCLKGDIFDLWTVYVMTENLNNIGINIVTPVPSKTVLNNQLTDIFNSLIQNINTVTDKNTKIGYLESLQNNYKGTVVYNFIENLKTSLPDQ